MEVKRLAIKTSVIAFTCMSSDILSSLKMQYILLSVKHIRIFQGERKKKPSPQYNRYFSCRFSNLILSARSTFIFIPKLKKKNPWVTKYQHSFETNSWNENYTSILIDLKCFLSLKRAFLVVFSFQLSNTESFLTFPFLTKKLSWKVKKFISKLSE